MLVLRFPELTIQAFHRMTVRRGAEMSGTGSREAQRLAECFDPFHDPYLADPYPFFAETRAATPVFYSPDLEYWVVTRYHDIRQIFQTPKLFSAANTLAPLQPICSAAGHLLAEGGFRPVPTLTNNDPPGHTRVRRLANIAFTPRRVAAMEPLVRELTARFVEERLSSGRADLVRDLAWELPALVIFRVLGLPDEDVARVKAGAESRLLLMWGRPDEDEQIRLAHGMAAFWRYAETLVTSRAEHPRDDFTSDLLLARDGDVPALTHQEVTTIVYGLLFAGHETTTSLIGNALRRLLTDTVTRGRRFAATPRSSRMPLRRCCASIPRSSPGAARRPRRWRSAACPSRPTRTCSCCSAQRTATPRSLSIPTAATFTDGMPGSTSPSGTERTSAWVRRWVASRRAWCLRN
jgi:cytochrome P450